MKSALVLLSLFASLNVFAFEPVQTRLLSQARALTRQGITPVFVFDLDETTLDSTPRRFVSTEIAGLELCSEPTASRFDFECGLLGELRVEDIYRLPNVYDNSRILDAIGIQNREFEGQLDSRIINEYLSGRHLELDLPHRGADTFVRKLLQAGAEIYYISSRFDDVQRAGSMDTLVSNGMIGRDADSHLILRPRSMKSLEFKKMALAKVRANVDALQGRAKVVGVYENEPENMNAMVASFPEATGVFIEGACIECSVQVDPRAVRIEQY